jgi:hypothetical protein
MVAMDALTDHNGGGEIPQRGVSLPGLTHALGLELSTGSWAL